MPVAGDIAAVIEIIEHSKLLREGMLVRSDFRSVHGDGWVAVADSEIAKNLIERAVFLDDVNHVANVVFTGSERNMVHVAADGVAIRSVLSVSRQICWNILRGKRASEPRINPRT